MVLSPLLHGEINLTDLREETVEPSLCHSYRSPIKRQVITLPSHGQNTAAVKHIVTGQAGPLILIRLARGDVFGKQARLSVCRVPSLSFSLSLGAYLCGVNGYLFGCFSSCFVCSSVPSVFGSVKVRWVVRFRFTRMQGESH